MSRTVLPGQLEQDLLSRLASLDHELAVHRTRRPVGSKPTRTRGRLGRRSRAVWLLLTGLAASALFATSTFAVVNDSGTVDVQVDLDTDACPTDTTAEGAKVTYLSEYNTCGVPGASGTGII